MNYYHIKCKDLGFHTCENTTTGSSAEEITRKILFHTMTNHEKEFEQLGEEQKMEISKTIQDTIKKQNYN